MIVRNQGVHLGPQDVLDISAGGLDGRDVNFGLLVDIGFHLPFADRIDHKRSTDTDHQEDQAGAQTKLGFDGKFFHCVLGRGGLSHAG